MTVNCSSLISGPRDVLSYRGPRFHFPRGMFSVVDVSFACRIKTGHSNLVSCFGPRMRALAKVFCRGESRGKIPCQRPNPRAKT